MTKKMKIISGGILVAAVVAGLAVLKTKDSQTSDEDTEMTETVAKPVGPAFNPDSAFAFTAKQCDFGPRVMNRRRTTAAVRGSSVSLRPTDAPSRSRRLTSKAMTAQCCIPPISLPASVPRPSGV